MTVRLTLTIFCALFGNCHFAHLALAKCTLASAFRRCFLAIRYVCTGSSFARAYVCRREVALAFAKCASRCGHRRRVPPPCFEQFVAAQLAFVSLIRPRPSSFPDVGDGECRSLFGALAGFTFCADHCGTSRSQDDQLGRVVRAEQTRRRCCTQLGSQLLSETNPQTKRAHRQLQCERISSDS